MTDYANIYEDFIDREDGPYIRLLTLLPKAPGEPSEEEELWNPKQFIEEKAARAEAEGKEDEITDAEVDFYLEQHFSGNKKPPTTDIEVEVSIHRFEDCPKYEALSYCWGVPMGAKFHIKCNGYSFYALPSLRDALYALRLPDKPRTLWIDAICINQNTDNRALNERGQQVSMMQDIYRKSNRTVVWLGEEGEKNFSPNVKRDIVMSDSMDMSDLEGFVSELEQSMMHVMDDLLTDPSKFWQEHVEVRTNWERMAPIIKNSAARVKAEWAQRPEGEPKPQDVNGLVDEKMRDMPNFMRKGAKFLATRKGWKDETMQLIMSAGTWRKAVQNIVSRVWWGRVWIIQELCLSRDVIFQCEDIHFGIDHLFLGVFLSSVFAETYSSRGSLVDGWTLPQMMEYRALYQGPGNSDLPSMLHLLAGFRISDATDPRDHVFALMGLLAASERNSLNEIGLLPDYTPENPAEECYIKTARALCTLSHSLDILALARPDIHEKKPDAAALPSWVPDWRIKNSTILSPTHGYESSSHGNASVLNFSAAGSTEWTPMFRDEKTLVISGYVADTIAKVVENPFAGVSDINMAGVFMDIAEAHDETDLELSMPQAMKSLVADVAVSWGKLTSIIYEWEEFVKANKAPYPTGEDLEFVACAVRCYGYMPEGPEAMVKSYKEFAKGTSRGRTIYNLVGPSKKEKASETKAAPSKLRQGLVALGTPRKDNAKYIAPFNALQKFSVGRRLAWTEKGYLALVPQETAAGDKVILCKGSKLPLVMTSTPQPNQWKVVEGCYIHGIMKGEAWDEAQCVEMELI